MPEMNVSEVFDAPADRLWALLRDFANLDAWWLPDSPIKIDRVEQEGEGAGMIRHIYYVGVPRPLSERLDFIDDDARTYRLSIVGEGVPGLLSYSATGVVTEMGPASCRLDYTADIEATAEKEAAVEQTLRFGFSQVIAGLRAATEG